MSEFVISMIVLTVYFSVGAGILVYTVDFYKFIKKPDFIPLAIAYVFWLPIVGYLYVSEKWNKLMWRWESIGFWQKYK